MTNVDDLVLVNALMRQALVAIEEVMGHKGLNAVLRTAAGAVYRSPAAG
jgi:hypothetical protein